MTKVEALQDFNLARFNEITNIQRGAKDVPGKLFTGDRFECSEEMADYLLGNNPLNKCVVKVIEYKPVKEANFVEKAEKPKKVAKKKKK